MSWFVVIYHTFVVIPLQLKFGIMGKLIPDIKKMSPGLHGISDFSFSDLIDIPDLQQLINHLSELAGCAIAIIDVNNKILVAANWQKICTCFHRINPETSYHCIESDNYMQQNLKTKTPVAYKCKNGLWDVAYPIIIEDKHIANIFLGQFFFDDEIIEIPYFENQAEKYGFDKTEYLNYLNEVPVISRKKVETLKQFNSALALILTKNGYANLLLKKGKTAELKIANQKTAESELKFRNLFEQAGAGVAQVESASGRFIKINKKFADIVGYTIDEMMKLTSKDFTHPDDTEISLQFHDRLINENHTEFSTEKRYIRKDGKIVWVKRTVTSLWEAEEGIRHHITIVQDISESKKAEQDLLESEFKFRKLFELAGVGVAQVDITTGKFVKVNKKLAEMLGYSIPEMLALTFKQVTYAEDLKESLYNQDRLIKKQIGDFSVEKRYIRKDGTVVWAILTASSMGEVAGGENFQIAIVQDITERKNSEQDLIESEEKFKNIFYQSPIGLEIYDFDGKLVDCNPACLSMFGIGSINEVAGFNLFEDPNLTELQKKEIKEGKDVQFELEFDFDLVKKLNLYTPKKSGRYFFNCVAISFKIKGNEKTGFLLHLLDITERKKAEQDLLESEGKFKSAFNQSPIGLELYDYEGNLLDCNQANLAILGIKNVKDLIGFNLFRGHHLSIQQIRDIKKGKNVHLEIKLDFDSEKKIRIPNSSKSGTCFLSCLATSFKTPENQKAGFLFHILDISQNKKAQQILKEESERFHTSMDAIDSMVYVADMTNHEILFVNKFVTDLFGKIIGKKCYSALHGKTEPCEFCTNHLLVDAQGNANQLHIWEFRNIVTNRWYQCHDQAIQWTNGNLVRFEIATDITKNIENEQALKETATKLTESNLTKDKFFSIIAHDLKNPFAILMSSAELLTRHLEKNDLLKSKAKAAMISKASSNGYALLDNLLVWAKSQTGGIAFTPKELNFKNSVSQSIKLIDELAKEKNIIIANEIPEHLIFEVDENILAVVFRNLITNAIKFSNNGGTITITAKPDNNCVEVAVIDTGIGIPKEQQYKLFRIDANFSRPGTANEPSTSLGLILCKEFIEKHNGTIWVESEVGKGSKFMFTLPDYKI